MEMKVEIVGSFDKAKLDLFLVYAYVFFALGRRI